MKHVDGNVVLWTYVDNTAGFIVLYGIVCQPIPKMSSHDLQNVQYPETALTGIREDNSSETVGVTIEIDFTTVVNPLALVTV